tara:strand:- start:1998 stop:2696 length:699 start_codon:yes stop_codon:yes gene_type:complete
MSEWINTFFFGIYPYIALSVLLIGSLIRFDREQYTWRSQSSQLLRRRQLVWGSILFHVGILVILFGHVGGLLTPVFLFEMVGISPAAKQLTAIIVGGTAGIVCLIGLVMLLHRRLFDPRIRKTSAPSDIAILLLLLAQLLLGLGTIVVSLNHMDGEEIISLMSWAQYIVTLRPGAANFVADVSPLVKAHLFLGLTIFLVFPFTRLVHIFSAPIWYLGRRGYQIVRTRRLGKA